MTPEERAHEFMLQLPIRGYSMENELAQVLREAVAEERAACAKLAEAQAESIEHELPGGSGGSWAKRFGRNVALSIVGAIRARANTETT